MLYSRPSGLTRKLNTMDLPIEESRLNEWLALRETDPAGAPLIQDAFPDLNDEQREFILTGVTPEEWETAFERKPARR